MLKPLSDRVVVKRLRAENVSPGGIHIPDNAAEKPEKGEVLAVGPGRYTDSGLRLMPSVYIGQKVLFGKYSGQTVKINGEDDILVMREEDILGVLDEEPSG